MILRNVIGLYRCGPDSDCGVCATSFVEIVDGSYDCPYILSSYAPGGMWNSLPVNIRQSKSFDSFKKQLKTFLYLRADST